MSGLAILGGLVHTHAQRPKEPWQRRIGIVWNVEVARLMHRHGDEWEPMILVGDPTPESNDLERRILRGERIFRCASCPEEVRVVGPDAER